MTLRPLVFMGSKAAGLAALTRLAAGVPRGLLAAIACPDDSDDERSLAAQFQAFADAQDLPLHIVRNRADLAGFVALYQPSAAIVHGWYRIIPVDEYPQTDFYGFHYSPLPRYRGSAPLVWQIINGEAEIGISLFQLSAGLDDGQLVGQRFFPLDQGDTIADALATAEILVDTMLDEFAQNWQAQTLVKFDQPDGAPSYCGMRIPADGRIDWTWPAKRVHDFIRAQTKPYPGAFTTLPDGRKLTIWSAHIEPRQFWGTAGAVVEVSSGKVVIACGSGAMVLDECQVEGEVSISADTLLRSMKVRLL
ncbi:methionyl-tRNA formyltransferase [Devosia beringensis]|uniref:methionyl-tRNA formyltransferase n=1 Tax=Devosia beringensis TaxID=2657486 RepID=UPI00186B90EB|nr:formyltransferase family protein [Devosia beringensis]